MTAVPAAGVGTHHAIQTFELTKQFPSGRALGRLLPGRALGPPVLDRVSLQIDSGELFGLLGPNGAGKTTLIKTLSTLIKPTSGTAWIYGAGLEQEAAVKSRIGLVTTDERSFYWRLTGRENLEFFAALQNTAAATISERISRLLDLVGREGVADKEFRKYSSGMRQRLAIARALIHQPRILFLDEPTQGLDPPAIRSLYSLLRERLRGEHQITVLLTTHRLSEAEQLCDRMAILHQGRIRAVGTLEELRDWARATSGLPAAGKLSLDDVFDCLIARSPLESDHLMIPSRPVNRTTRERGENLDPDFRPPSFLRIASAFLKRDFRSEISYRFSFLLQIASILLNIGIFYFISRLIGSAALPFLAEFQGNYFAFVLIGIAFARYFGVGLSSFARSLRKAQTTGTLEAMLATPTPLAAIVLSSSIWNYLLTTIEVVLFLAIGFLLDRQVLAHSNFLAAILVMVLTIFIFSSLGIMAASFIMVLKRGDPVTWIFNALSTFLGGVYYPISVLPQWLQFFAYLVPVTYGLNAMRKALLQGASISQLLPELAALFLFSAVLLPSGLLAFELAVGRAREDGSLTHY